MTTNRRHVLRLCGLAGTGALTGCLDRVGGDGPTSTDWTSQAKLTADDREDADWFGGAVAVSSDGTTAIIGAENDGNQNGDQAGSAYVFEYSSGSWSQQTKLTADDGDSGDGFGRAVAVSDDGDTAIIGAENMVFIEGKKGQGSAYVFESSGGSWSQQAKLTADDGDDGDQFGRAVAVSGDGTTALIGALYDEDPNGDNAGSAYVFGSSSGSWSQQTKLAADDGDSKDDFGRAVAVSGDGTTALIGAALDEDPNGHFAGSAYVFETSKGSWSQQAKLTADDGDSEDAFGWSVSVSSDGTTALIGAFGDEDPNGDTAGSAYVFESSNGSWSQQAKLTADDGDSDDWFGRAVAVSDDGTTALIGARNKLALNTEPKGKGKAYVFEDSDGSWGQQTRLPLDDDEGHRFGGAVAVSGSGNTAVIGDSQQIIKNVGPAGMAYVFTQ